MSESSGTSSGSTSTSKSTSKKGKEPESTGLEQAQEQGYIGTVSEAVPNDAYTVSGQGEDTVKLERQALRDQRTEREDSSGEGGS